MKKFMVCVVFATMLFSMGAKAQSIADIKRVEVVEQEFFVVTDNDRVQVAPLVYKIVEDNPAAYKVVGVGTTKTIFAEKAIGSPEQYVFEVSEVKLENDKPKVFMTNGYAFSDSDLAWLAVQKGQHVMISRYYGLTKELTVFETVSRQKPLTTDVDVAVASAPGKSRLPQMIEEVKARQKAKAEAEVKAKEEADAKKEEAKEPVTINFGHRK